MPKGRGPVAQRKCMIAIGNCASALDAIVYAVPTPVAVIDERLRVQSANRAFLAVFELAMTDVTGRSLLELGDWRPPELGSRLDAAAATRTRFDDIEAVYVGAAGERVLRLAASPIPPCSGRALTLIGIADITERQRLEQMRSAAARERDAFLDAISHELRTPLSAILLWAQLLRDLDPADPRHAEGIDTIIASARCESELVDDLLELALSRTGVLNVKLEPLDPSLIVEAAIDAMRNDAGDKYIAIDIELARGLQIAADAARLHQITAKLVSNAIKFTPEGGRVMVSLAIDRGVLELRVRDNGHGIAPGFLPRAFEPFSRADDSTTRVHRGLGIGLALVRHFVERQGGTIDVTSLEGEGATFTVRIPAGTAP
jgi:two-component system CheB/CheR fusion protein